jgi:hypothetical protein
MLALGVTAAVFFASRVVHYARQSRMELYFHPTI